MSHTNKLNERTLKIINDSKTKNFIDLGNCGLILKDNELLNQLKSELSEFSNLVEINLGNFIWHAGIRVSCRNGRKNTGGKLSDVLKILPKNIKTLHLCDVELSDACIIDIEGISCADHLVRLEMSDNDIRIFNLGALKNLKFVGLSYNKISSLYKDLKKDYNESILPDKIENLHLLGNDIEQIDDKYFESYKNIKSLDLSKTKLESLAPLKHLDNLNILYLNDISINWNSKSTKEILLKLHKLQWLDNEDMNSKGNFKKSNQINASLIRYSMFKFENEVILKGIISQSKTRINVLNLFNLIEKLSYSYPCFIIYNFILNNFEGTLDLGNCNLRSQDLNKGKDGKNEYNLYDLLKFIKNKITILNLGPDYLSSKVMKISESTNNDGCNYFESFDPIDLSVFINLKEVHLRKCNLNTMPFFGSKEKSSTSKNYPKLELIDVSINNIKKFDFYTKSTSKLTLRAQSNKCRNLKIDATELRFETIDLSSNNLKSADICVKSLGNLNLANNSIRDIKDCKIITTNDIIPSPSLNLDLHGNQIELNIVKDDKLLQSYLNYMDSLKLNKFDLISNPIDSFIVPYNVLDQRDYKTLKTYFNELYSFDDKVNLKNTRIIKLMILGDQDTGKSSFSSLLKSNSPDPRIKFIDWLSPFQQLEDENLTIENTDQNIQVKVFDFDLDLFSTDAFKFWLDNDTVFLVLWENKNNKHLTLAKLEYWLDTIANKIGFFEKSNIFLMQTNIKDYYKDKLYLDREFLEKYAINDIYYFDNEKTDEYKAIEKLNSYLRRYFSGRHVKRKDEFYSYRNSILNLAHKDENEIQLSQLNDLVMNNLSDETFLIVVHSLINLNYIYTDTTDPYNFINPSRINKEIKDIFKLIVDYGRSDFTFSELQRFAKMEENKYFSKFVINLLASCHFIYKIDDKNEGKNDPYEFKFKCSRMLLVEDSVEDILELFEIDEIEDSLVLKLPKYYYRLVLDAFFIRFAGNDFEVKHHWRDGLFLLFLDGSEKKLSKIFIRGVESDNAGRSHIRFFVQKNELQSIIYKRLTSFIENLTFKSDLEELRMTDELFLSRLEYSVGDSNNFKYLSNIRKGLEDNQVEFTNYAKYFNYSTQITSPKNLFISYSHNDAEYMYKLKSHLSVLRRSNLINDWVDTEIMAGDNWESKIMQNINKADIFIFLLSADLVTSNYTIDKELTKALEAVKLKRAKIMPIYIRPFDISAFPLVRNQNILDFEIVPKKEEKLLPISMWSNQDEAFRVVTSRLREMLKQ